MTYKINAESWHYKWHNKVERGWTKLFNTYPSSHRLNLCPYLRTILLKPFMIAFWWIMKYPLIAAFWLVIVGFAGCVLFMAFKLVVAVAGNLQTTAIIVGVIATAIGGLWLCNKAGCWAFDSFRAWRAKKVRPAKDEPVVLAPAEPAKVKKAKQPGFLAILWQYVKDWHDGVCRPIEVV